MPKLNYDYPYRASENTTSASRGRLNNADSAWCFHYEKFVGQKAFFTVDLGAIHLISGFQSQGPPQKLHPKEYLRYVGLDIELSLDGISWEHTVHDNGAKMSVSIFQLHLCTRFISCQQPILNLQIFSQIFSQNFLCFCFFKSEVFNSDQNRQNNANDCLF